MSSLQLKWNCFDNTPQKRRGKCYKRNASHKNDLTFVKHNLQIILVIQWVAKLDLLMEQFESTISWQLTTYLKPYHRRVSSECSINQGEFESFPAFTSSFVLISWLFHWNHTPSWTDHNIIDAQSLRSLAHPTQSKGRLKPPRRFMYCLEQIGKTSANYPSNADKLMTIKLHFRRKTFWFSRLYSLWNKAKETYTFFTFCLHIWIYIFPQK